MTPRSSRGRSIRQRGARPPQPRAVSAQDLGKLEGLAGLSLRKLDALRARMRIRPFSKHSIVYKEGESDDAVYILLSGIARLICLNRKGKRKNCGELWSIAGARQKREKKELTQRAQRLEHRGRGDAVREFLFC